MTREEMLPKFQEICPPCFFCQTKHGGEGYSDQRMEDVLTGVERGYLGFYLCPACQPRRAEADDYYRHRAKHLIFIEMLRERNLYHYDEKYKLAEVDPKIRADNVNLFTILDEYPLPRNTWVYGLYGRGKTHTCLSVGNRYVDDLKGAALISGPRFRDIGEEFGQKRAALLKPYGRVPLLIIDDIDKALRWTENSLETLWTIMDDRERASLRTVVTSQKTPQGFFKGIEKMIPGSGEFSASILDRLKPLSVFEFQGQPRRGQ